MTSSRDRFVAELIAALEENERLAQSHVFAGQQGTDAADAADPASTFLSLKTAYGGHDCGSVSTEEAMARAAYETLQYDFPLLDEAQLRALAVQYQLIATGRVQADIAAQYAITATMLDGIEYLNDVSASSKRRGSEASGLLAAALLLLVPRLCLSQPDSPLAATLLSKLDQRVQSDPPSAALPPNQNSLLSSMMQPLSTQEEGFNGDFVEVYAQEEDADDVIYEGDALVGENAALATGRANSTLASLVHLTPPSRAEQLRHLASKTFSTTFSMISSDQWTSWQLDDVVADLIRLLVDGCNGTVDEDDESDDDDTSRPLYGARGEWQRYLFILRDQQLRFVSANSLLKLTELVTMLHETGATDGVFAGHKPLSPALTVSQPLRMVFRVLAELAVSKEFNSPTARRAQHELSAALQSLFPVIHRELQRLAPMLTKQADFSALYADFVVVLLQLVHFVMAAATDSRRTVDNLQESGILRAWLAFLPTEVATTPYNESSWSWLSPLMRLFGECALWNADFAVYVNRVPKIVALLPTVEKTMNIEILLLWLAADQHSIHFPLAAKHDKASLAREVPNNELWTLFRSESIFPSTCETYLQSMQKMSDVLFILECLSKAVAELRPEVLDQLRSSLQQVYSTRFASAFEYPSFAVPSSTLPSPDKDEPEPPPAEDSALSASGTSRVRETEDDDRGQSEALQFIALRNRVRQCAKTILLASSSGSSSKLD